jgi:hypothetical protein
MNQIMNTNKCPYCVIVHMVCDWCFLGNHAKCVRCLTRVIGDGEKAEHRLCSCDSPEHEAKPTCQSKLNGVACGELAVAIFSVDVIGDVPMCPRHAEALREHYAIFEMKPEERPVQEKSSTKAAWITMVDIPPKFRPGAR